MILTLVEIIKFNVKTRQTVLVAFDSAHNPAHYHGSQRQLPYLQSIARDHQFPDAVCKVEGFHLNASYAPCMNLEDRHKASQSVLGEVEFDF